MGVSESLQAKIKLPRKQKVKRFKKAGVVYTPPHSSLLGSLRKIAWPFHHFEPKSPKPQSPHQDQQKDTFFTLSMIRKITRNLGLMLIPIVLFVIFFILTLINTIINVQLVTKQVSPSPSVVIHPYPLVQSSHVPIISAKAAIVMDADTKVILFAKRPDLRFSLASTTKIMTALVGLDYYHEDSLLQVKSTSVEGSQIGLQAGDSIYFQDLLYAMLLPSANDAAVTVAENYPGGVPVFVEQMNKKATELHLANTHFSDPVGLNDDGDFSTVFDMAHLAAFAESNREFATVANTKEKIIITRGYGRTYTLTNLNKLLGIHGVNGIKTGTTEGAGEVLVTSTVQNGHDFIIVVMNSSDRFADTETLIDFLKYIDFVSPEPLPVIN